MVLYTLLGTQKMLYIDQPNNVNSAYIKTYLSNNSVLQSTEKTTAVLRQMGHYFSDTTKAFYDTRSYKNFTENYLHFNIKFVWYNKTSHKTIDFEPTSWNCILLNPPQKVIIPSTYNTSSFILLSASIIFLFIVINMMYYYYKNTHKENRV